MRPILFLALASGPNPEDRFEHPDVALLGIEAFVEKWIAKANQLGMEFGLHMPCLRDPGDYLSDSFQDVPESWRAYFRSTRFERAMRECGGMLNVYLPFFTGSARTMTPRERADWTWRTFAPWERLYGRGVRCWGDMAVQDPEGMKIVDAELGGKMGAEALPFTKGDDGLYHLQPLEPHRPHLCTWKFLTGQKNHNGSWAQEPRDPYLTAKVNRFCQVLMEFDDLPTIEQAKRLRSNGWTIGCFAGGDVLFDPAGVWMGDV